MENKIELGDEVEDPISGIVGIVTTISQFLTGCERCSVQQQGVNKVTGKPYEWIAFDVPALKLLKKAKIKKTEAIKRDPGGPRDQTPKY